MFVPEAMLTVQVYDVESTVSMFSIYNVRHRRQLYICTNWRLVDLQQRQRLGHREGRQDSKERKSRRSKKERLAGIQ